MTDKLYKVTEVAAFLNVKTLTVYKMIENGHIKAIKIGRTVRISKNENPSLKEIDKKENSNVTK